MTRKSKRELETRLANLEQSEDLPEAGLIVALQAADPESDVAEFIEDDHLVYDGALYRLDSDLVENARVG